MCDIHCKHYACTFTTHQFCTIFPPYSVIALQHTLPFTLNHPHLTVLLTTLYPHSMQALDAALKLFKSQAPNTAAMLFSVDHDNNKVICLCIVPNVSEKCTSNGQSIHIL